MHIFLSHVTIIAGCTLYLGLFKFINLPMISLVKSWGLKLGLGVGYNGQYLYMATRWCQESGHSHPCLPRLETKPRSVGWRFGEVAGMSRKLDRSDVDGDRIFLMVWCNPNLESWCPLIKLVSDTFLILKVFLLSHFKLYFSVNSLELKCQMTPFIV